MFKRRQARGDLDTGKPECDVAQFHNKVQGSF